MNPRYYWISALIVIGLTLTIGFATQRKTGRDLALIGVQVICGLFVLVGLVSGLVKLLVFLGIAEEGFVIIATNAIKFPNSLLSLFICGRKSDLN